MENRGDIQAVVIYNNFTSNSLDMHVASVGDRKWLSRPFLSAVFSYPFVQLGLGRVSAKIGANNSQAARFLRHLGFTHEGTHPEGWEKGIALLSFGLLKEQCRFLGDMCHRQIVSTTGTRSERNGGSADAIQYCDFDG